MGRSLVVNRCSATPAASTELVKVRCGLVWTRRCGIRRLTGLAAAALLAAVLSGCGSGDSTVAKTPQPTTHPTAAAALRSTSAGPPTAAPTSPGPADPCAVNLAAPAIARGVSELPHDPRSQQPWNPEPLAGNYNQCAQLSAVIVKANTNAESPNTRAVMFHLGKLIPPQGVPDTYGFNGHRHLAVHRRHGGAELLRRYRLAQRGEVPLERQRGGADRQRRLTTAGASCPASQLRLQWLLCSWQATASSTARRISQPPLAVNTPCCGNSTRNSAGVPRHRRGRIAGAHRRSR